MSALDRFSFHQLLLVAFLLIAGLLSAASLRGLFTLQGLIAQSSQGAQRSVALTAAAQRLAERSVAMERSARQYVVLDDPLLRQQFDLASREAADALAPLAQGLRDSDADAARADADAQAWRDKLLAVRAQLDAAQGAANDARKANESALTASFRDIERVNIALADRVRRATESRSAALLAQLETGRADLARQIAAAIAVAVVLALACGVWLARPLKRLEAAVVGLGENRLEVPIDMQGPADVRQLGRRLEWLRLRLAEIDADKARFLRHVSHELKTPLAALHEGVALLEDGVTGVLTEPQRAVARILRQNTAVLKGQIDDLLRFNTAAFDARRLVRRPTDLNALITAQITLQQLQCQARQLTLVVSGAPLQVEVDADQLGVALGNLLSNAIRFSPLGGRIEFAVSRWPGRARIDVTDQGPGVAPADRARVFEPFFRGERQPADAPRGSGIGLSIVQELVRAHDGQIDLLMADECHLDTAGQPRPAGVPSTDLSTALSGASPSASLGAVPGAPLGAPLGASLGAHFRIELPHVVAI